MSVVGGEDGEGAFAVLVGGVGVDAQGVQPGVAHQVGDQDGVDAGADELGGEGVAQDVRPERLAP